MSQEYNYPVSKKRSLLKNIFISFILIFLAMIITVSVYIYNLNQNLPDISGLKDYSANQTSIIYDKNNQVLAKLFDEENRQVIPLEKIPENVKNAVIAMEDERYYKHHGVDLKGSFRAFISIVDPSESYVKSGGSTITQQLARNIFLSRETTIKRKLSEMLLAFKIEQNYTKDEILELYLNEVYWGHNSYGIESAAKTYFNKPAKELSLAEATLICGILSAPEAYSPYRDFEKAKWRQSLTLENMKKNAFISEAEAKTAAGTDVRLAGLKNNYKMKHPYFTSYVISILKKRYGDRYLSKAGLKIYTTMEPQAQTLAEKLIRDSVTKLKKTRNASQGVLLSIDPESGHIKSLVGGTDFEKSQFNRATQARRQPGSAFKPVVYLSAFLDGLLTPDTKVIDEAVSYPAGYGKSWSPRNYGGNYSGEMTVADALRRSVNTISVKTADMVGIGRVIETAEALGIESTMQQYLPIALGASELTPLELAEAYAVFATGGNKVEKVTPILKITDSEGNIIEDNTNPYSYKVFPGEPINMINYSLKQVVSRGTGYAANIPGRVIAGKTGTTSDYKDAWFVGYTPQLVTLVWFGNDNNTKMWGATGGVVCAPVWKKYMSKVLSGMPVEDFPADDQWRERGNIIKLVVAEEEEEKTNESSDTEDKQVSITEKYMKKLKSLFNMDEEKETEKKPDLKDRIIDLDREYENLQDEISAEANARESNQASPGPDMINPDPVEDRESEYYENNPYLILEEEETNNNIPEPLKSPSIERPERDTPDALPSQAIEAPKRRSPEPVPTSIIKPPARKSPQPVKTPDSRPKRKVPEQIPSAANNQQAVKTEKASEKQNSVKTKEQKIKEAEINPYIDHGLIPLDKKAD